MNKQVWQNHAATKMWNSNSYQLPQRWSIQVYPIKNQKSLLNILKWQKFSVKKSCLVESSSWKIKQQNVNYEVSISPVWRITHSLLGADGKVVVTCCYYPPLHHWKVQPSCYSFLQLCCFCCGWNKRHTWHREGKEVIYQPTE